MVNRGKFFCGILLLLLLLLFTGTLEARERVGVLDFTGNVNREFRMAAANRLTRILIDLGRFDVIERGEVDRILQEQHFQMTGLVDLDTAVKAGQILGVNQAFIGHIDRLTSTWDQGMYRAEARITVKVIDVATSTLLHIVEASGTASDGNSSSASHQALETALGESFINNLRSRFAITSIVTQVSGRTVYLVGGQDMGIKKGYRYRILRPDDPTVSFDDAFHREVGLLEIEDVTASRSRGRIIYALSPIRPNDIVREVPYNTQGVFSLSLKSQQVSLNEGEEVGIAPLAEFSYSNERPFGYSYSLLFGIGFFQDILMMKLGLGGGLELPVVPGSLYLTAGAGGGFYLGAQSHTSYTISWRSYDSGSASAANYYVSGEGGIKYYLNYDKGVRLQIGVTGIYAGTLSSWQNEAEHNMNNYVEYKKVDITGLGIMASLSFPFGQGLLQ